MGASNCRRYTRDEICATAKRIIARVEVDTETGCWNWPGKTQPGGYGQIKAFRILSYTHRIMCEYGHGPIPDGLQVDHLCRNRRCCNPEHLEAVTHRENTLRGDTIPAANARKTHCKHGHEFTPENTYLHRGLRSCLQCRRDRQQARLTLESSVPRASEAPTSSTGDTDGSSTRKEPPSGAG